MKRSEQSKRKASINGQEDSEDSEEEEAEEEEEDQTVKASTKAPYHNITNSCDTFCSLKKPRFLTSRPSRPSSSPRTASWKGTPEESQRVLAAVSALLEAQGAGRSGG